MHGIALLFRQQPSLSLHFQYQKNHYLKTFLHVLDKLRAFPPFHKHKAPRRGINCLHVAVIASACLRVVSPFPLAPRDYLALTTAAANIQASV